MASVSHRPAVLGGQPPRWLEYLRITELWAGVSIVVMWLAVLFDGVFGPDFVSRSAGGDTTTIPSSVGVALFALLGTVTVARHGFGPRQG